jgi:hypothetical protein
MVSSILVQNYIIQHRIIYPHISQFLIYFYNLTTTDTNHIATFLDHSQGDYSGLQSVFIAFLDWIHAWQQNWVTCETQTEVKENSVPFRMGYFSHCSLLLLSVTPKYL